MRILTAFILFLFVGCTSATNDEISKSPKEDKSKNQTDEVVENSFLRTYVARLKADTPAPDLDRIRSMAKSELILLHHGYGTGIRNKWLRGNRDPELIRFFQDRSVSDPDDMSMIIIEALWEDLNANLRPEERASIEAKRAVVARKRLVYEKLEAQCMSQLQKSQAKIEDCYAKHGLPSENPSGQAPFYRLVVDKTGHVREIVFFKGESTELKDCLREAMQGFQFDAFTDDETITLYILEFPVCRVSERDSLHSD